MSMKAKVAQKIAKELGPLTRGDQSEYASDADRKEINKIAKEFLNAFETDYRAAIKERKRDK
jgi:hypothetical protein